MRSVEENLLFEVVSNFEFYDQLLERWAEFPDADPKVPDLERLILESQMDRAYVEFRASVEKAANFLEENGNPTYGATG